jgi:hypothetical protein
VHTPAAQKLAALVRVGHALPHVPQLPGSNVVLVQAPEQLVRPVPHVVVHTPAEHTCPAPHRVPHAPQFALSVLVLTSHPLIASPSQLPEPALHVPSVQLPAAQVAPALGNEQRSPQPPQLLASVAFTAVSQPFAAMPSQLPKPVLHAPTIHAPAEHACVATLASAQRASHAPQLFTSVAVLAHVPEQLVVPAPHVVVHAPREHTWPAAHARGEAAVEHAPQLPLSLCTLVSQPLDAIPSQSAKPAAHAPMAHVPLIHIAVAFAKEHRIPQPPQLFASAPRTSVSQPLAAIPSQLPLPAAHAPTTHAPAAQACVATPASAHTVVHEPQCVGSVAVATQLPLQLVSPAPHDVAQAPIEHT